MMTPPRRLALASLCLLLFPAPSGAQERWELARDRVIASGADASTPLTQVGDLAVGGDGSVYVLQPQDASVRVFSAEGRPLRTLGRRGQGPGEFTFPRDLGWRGDTLVVSDPDTWRISGFLAGGRGVFTHALTPLGQLQPRALLANGRVLATSQLLFDVIASGALRSEDLVLTDRAGRSRQSLARLPLLQHVAHARVSHPAGPHDLYFPQPFGYTNLYDVDPSGRWVVVVSRPVAEGARSHFTVRRLTPAGTSAWTARVSYTPVTIPPAAVTDTVESYTDRYARSPSFRVVPRATLGRALRSAIYVPPRLPAVRAVVAGRDGTTWIQRNATGPRAPWIVLDDAGRHIASIEIPAALAVLAVDREHVWGVEKDADDLPSVVRYRVVRPRRAR